MLRFRTIPGSNLDPKARYPDTGLLLFFSFTKHKGTHNVLRQVTSVSSHILSKITIYVLSYCDKSFQQEVKRNHRDGIFNSATFVLT